MMVGRILVIEDNQHVLELVRDVLESAGHQVIGLQYPDLVLDVVSRERPDVILTDVMLPNKSGIDVADLLWTNGFGTTPMLAMSALSIMLDLARQMPFFQDVIRKPFDVDTVLDAVDRALLAQDVTQALDRSEV